MMMSRTPPSGRVSKRECGGICKIRIATLTSGVEQHKDRHYRSRPLELG